MEGDHELSWEIILKICNEGTGVGGFIGFD
jgi:hypothetical protein